MVDLNAGVAITVAVGTMAAAIAAAVSAYWARRGASGPLLNELITEYASPQMADALRRLEELSAKHGNELPLLARKGLEAEDPKWLEVDQYRRMVKFYFLKIDRLYHAGTLHWKPAQEALSVAGWQVYESIVVGLEPSSHLPDPPPHERVLRTKERLERMARVLSNGLTDGL